MRPVVLISILLTLCCISCNKGIDKSYDSSYFSVESSQVSLDEQHETFVNLKDAYNQNLISDNDLMNICYRNNNNHLYEQNKEIENGLVLEEIEVNEDQIIPLAPFDDEIKTIIINDYYLFIQNDDRYKTEIKKGNITIDDIRIAKYCGVYSDYYAIRFDEPLCCRLTVEGKEKIGDYWFIWPYLTDDILLWKSI